MNTCAVFCAACIGGNMLAFTVPRQMIPRANPSDSRVGLISWATNRS